MAEAASDTLETCRLRLSPVGETDRPEEFLDLFNSNPNFIEASKQFTGKRSYDLSEAEMYLWVESNRENSRCLGIRRRVTGELVGTACLLVPHEKEPYPWIGLLLIHGQHQNQGLGAEAARAIDAALAWEGWPEVRLGVLQANPGARRFWERLGYQIIDERPDQDKRPCWIMRKRLARAAAGEPSSTSGTT
jgi:RimJ/RimL family protein N-acetyltransferase